MGRYTRWKWTVRYEAQSPEYGKIFTLKKVACDSKTEADELLQGLPAGTHVDKDLYNQVYTITLPQGCRVASIK